MLPSRKILVFIAAGIFLAAAGTLAVVATNQGGDDCPFTDAHAAEHCATWNAHGAYCEAHPDEAHCKELLQHAQHARFCRDNPDDTMCADPATHDPHAQYCRDNPDSPRCKA